MNKAWFILLLFVAVACQQNKQEAAAETKMETVKDSEGEDMYYFKGETASMKAAIEEAKKTYPLFEQNIFAGEPGTDHFAIKMIFRGDDSDDYLWLTDLHKKDGVLYGVLYDAPLKAGNIKTGDTLKIEKKRVSDWVYAENGKMMGGYTIRVIYKNMSAAEKKEYQSSIPYKIE
jgi:uncharacterized protein YegJ (DUF2314 family)